MMKRSIDLTRLSMARALFLMLPLMAPAIQAADIQWTGQAGDGLWSNTNNWQGGVLPGAADRAVFGSSATNGPHTVVVDDVYTVRGLLISGGDLRSFEFSRSGEGVLQVDKTAAGHGIDIAGTVTADVIFDVPIEVLSTAGTFQSWIIRNSGSHTLYFNNAFYSSITHYPRINFQNGKHVINGRFSGALVHMGAYGTADVSIHSSNFSILHQLRYYVNSTATYRFGIDAAFQRELEMTAAGSIQNVRAGDEDVTLEMGRQLMSLHDAARLVFLDNAAGANGRFILRTTGNWTTIDGNHTLPVDTRANTYVEFNPANEASMTYGANTNRAMRISGEGHLWKSGSGLLNVRTENTYSGRTMISGGTLQLNSHTLGEDTYYGQLPAATVVEIAAGAVFNLNGINQTVGGLTNWTGLEQTNTPSSGSVALGGATLTIHAAQASAFGGQVTGTGTLVKAGAGTFTLTAGYTNAVDRTLRVEDGLLAVTGALSVEAGTFELAGGRVAAGSLAATGTVWNVTLTPGSAEQALVDVDTAADITGATLELALAGGYEPALDTRFTLLRADTIDGASEAGLFGRAHGDDFWVDGTHLRITFETGSENVVLTVIPEPASLLLLATSLAGLLWMRHRRGRV